MSDFGRFVRAGVDGGLTGFLKYFLYIALNESNSHPMIKTTSLSVHQCYSPSDLVVYKYINFW
jgi:hypothetical protein